MRLQRVSGLLASDKRMQNVKVKTQISSKILFGLLPLLAVVLLASCAVAPPKEPVKVLQAPIFPAPPDEARFIYEGTFYSSADVVKEAKNAGTIRMLSGEVKTGIGMSKPYGVAVYHGRVYVSDTVKRNVAVFDIPGQRFYTLGEDEIGKLTSPMGLDVDGKGNLYVMDVGAKLVQVYDTDGKHLRTMLDGGKWFIRPSGIAVDAEGSRMYVVDTGGVSSKPEEHRVRVFDAQSGKHLLDIGKRGNAPGELNLPCDVTIGKEGLLYVVDCGNFRVQAFKPDGTFVRTFGVIGRQAGQFSRPKEAATDPDGNVYVIDTAFGNFQIFTPDGKLLLAVGSRSEIDGMAKYMLPSGIAIDGDGRVYMVDQFFRKLEVYRPAKLAAGEGFTVKQDAPSQK